VLWCLGHQASGLASARQGASIFTLFRDREHDIFWEGQVCGFGPAVFGCYVCLHMSASTNTAHHRAAFTTSPANLGHTSLTAPHSLLGCGLQVRQTPAPHFWDATHTGPNTYQDGAYWGTPLDHVLAFIGTHDHSMACRLLHDAIASYRSHGINEWVGPFYPAKSSGAQGYVASAAGAYRASRLLRCSE
jgi:hypothetical protein